MEREAQRLATLVQEIIDLSRLQVADALHPPEPVVVDDVVAEAVDRCRLAAQRKRIEVVIGGDPGAVVYGDHSLLVTAVRNLVDNAIAYSPDATRIGVGVRRARGLVEVAVSDQGLGISPSEQARIFERFYRVDPARSRATGGTGLGLSIVKHVAANHGGEVTLWSVEGQGSTFTLRLPDSAHAAATYAASDDGAAQPSAPATPATVTPATVTPAPSTIAPAPASPAIGIRTHPGAEFDAVPTTAGNPQASDPTESRGVVQ
jgi:two-component system sensor histidine kinase SenX3